MCVSFIYRMKVQLFWSHSPDTVLCVSTHYKRYLLLLVWQSLSLSLSFLCLRTVSVCTFCKIIGLLQIDYVRVCWFLREGEIVLSLCTYVKLEIFLLVKNRWEVLTYCECPYRCLCNRSVYIPGNVSVPQTQHSLNISLRAILVNVKATYR